jgi:hypothetical protein
VSYTTVTATLDRQTIEIELTEDDIEGALGFVPSSLCEDEVMQLAQDAADSHYELIREELDAINKSLEDSTLLGCLRRWRVARKVQAILGAKS